jgi:hypothetical protein
MANYKFDTSFTEKFIQTCENSQSMNKAAVTLGMNYKTLCSHAKRL